MKRRLNLAAGLLHDPDILLLDEPTVGVDPQSRNAIFDNLEELKRRGKALLYTTHYMEEAERLADRIVVIDHGKVVASDTLDGLYARVPAKPARTCVARGGVPHAHRKEPARLMRLTYQFSPWSARTSSSSSGFGDAAGLAFFNGENKPELELLYDPSRNAELGMVRGMLMGDVIQAVSKEVFTGTRGGVLAERSMASLDSSNLPVEQKRRLLDVLNATRNLELGNAQAGTSLRPPGMTTPYTVKQTAAMANPNANYNSFAHSFGGMGIQFLLMAAIDLGIGVLLERQRGLWNRLRSAPISKAALLGGKAISGTLISLTTLLVSFSFAMIVFKVRIHGSVPGFLGIAAATAFMASTFGLLVAALGRTPNTARRAAIFATLVMVMLGGAWVPSFFFPPWMQEATKVFPTRWAVNGLDDMTWRGVGWSGAVAPIMILLGFAVLFGAVAAWQFRWEE
jgi:ABC-2 type transport system permease protein